MKKDFDKYLELSDELRKGYKQSLMSPQNDWAARLGTFTNNKVPELLKIIYSQCSGTLYETRDQRLMDFVPGYLLIHISEYDRSQHDLNAVLNQDPGSEEFYPILRNYSSDFYALNAKTNEIHLVFHDDHETHLIHRCPEDFLKTLIDNYQERVYFLDEDGFLDYDVDLEYKIARKHNENLEYWEEDLE